MRSARKDGVLSHVTERQFLHLYVKTHASPPATPRCQRRHRLLRLASPRAQKATARPASTAAVAIARARALIGARGAACATRRAAATARRPPEEAAARAVKARAVPGPACIGAAIFMDARATVVRTAPPAAADASTSPHLAIMTSKLVSPPRLPHASIALTTE